MKKLFLALAIIISPICLHAQKYSIGTNVADWLTFGTLNAEASIAVARHFTINAGIELNPWQYNTNDVNKQFQVKQRSIWGGAKYWPWFVYSGWWVGADLRYSIYNMGGLIKRETEEGSAYGAGIYAGYSIMINDSWNLDLGIGGWGGLKQYTTYACPRCGVTIDKGNKGFILPDLRVAIQLIF